MVGSSDDEDLNALFENEYAAEWFRKQLDDAQFDIDTNFPGSGNTNGDVARSSSSSTRRRIRREKNPSDAGSTNTAYYSLNNDSHNDEERQNDGYYISPLVRGHNNHNTTPLSGLGLGLQSFDELHATVPDSIDVYGIREEVQTLRNRIYELESDQSHQNHNHRSSFTSRDRAMFARSIMGISKTTRSRREAGKYGLDEDTFTLMMLDVPLSKSWSFGLATFAFQIILASMIIQDQILEGKNSSTFNVPFKVERWVLVGQFLTLIICLCTQNDILSSIQTLGLLKRSSRWDLAIGEEGKNDNKAMWFRRIFIPQMFKLIMGILVMFVSFVIIVQSENIIPLLKDFTALMVLSEADNIFFSLASYGYVGHELQEKTDIVKSIEFDVETDPREAWTRSSGFFAIFLILFGLWVFIIYNQFNGAFFRQRYQGCKDNYDLAKLHFGDGECYGGENKTDAQKRVGNGECDAEFDNAECDFDGGDCCDRDIFDDKRYNDGKCDAGYFNTKKCGYDGNDCFKFNTEYPDCPLEELKDMEGSNETTLGDGICDSGIYTTEECGFGFGDCDRGQIGQDILVDDVANLDILLFEEFGFDMNADGTVVAVGSPFYDHNITNQTDVGKVKVLHYNPVKMVWEQLGNDIVGENDEDRSGWRSIALSSSGTRVAIGVSNSNSGENVTNTGQVRVFDIRGQEWIQVGEFIDGKEAYDYSGHRVAMTDDGSRLAIASPNNDELWNMAGSIRVYDYDPVKEDWDQVGKKDIIGQAEDESLGLFGLSLASARGDTLACSVGRKESSFRIFLYNAGNEEWTPISDALFEKLYNETLVEEGASNNRRTIPRSNNTRTIPRIFPQTSSFVLSSNGNRIAFSANEKKGPTHNNFGSDDLDVSHDVPHMVRIYDFNRTNDTWSKVGNDIVGFPADKGSELTLTMNASGGLLAVGTRNDRGAGGSVQFYEYNETRREWMSMYYGQRLIERNRDRKNSIFGVAMSLSDDASIFSVSGYNVNKGRGFVKVYNVSEMFPKCRVKHPEWIGNGSCESNRAGYNTTECGYDGGDCLPSGTPECIVSHPSVIGNGRCDTWGLFHTKECNYDNGDCEANRTYYDDCFVPEPGKIGDGKCDDFPPYNTEKCNFDGRDCVMKTVEGYPHCEVVHPEWIGDGNCTDYPPYNSKRCGYDGKDCEPKPTKLKTCFVFSPEKIDDGICDNRAPYNTEKCEWDGGDCTYEEGELES